MKAIGVGLPASDTYLLCVADDDPGDRHVQLFPLDRSDIAGTTEFTSVL